MRTAPLLLLLLLCTCAPAPTPMQIAQSNIEASLKKLLHDPDSYEFVEMSPFDSITNIDKMGQSIDFNLGLIPIQQRGLTAAQGLLYSQKESLRMGIISKDKVAETQAIVDKKKADIKALIDNTQKMIEDKKAASVDTVYNYTTLISYRAKNAVGATVLKTKKAKLGTDLSFVKLLD